MLSINPAWHILSYHDISWEENCYLRSIGGTVPPDIFRSHVATCAQLGTLVSIEEGARRLLGDKIDGPLFSFWFDDGLIGVRKNALPILEDFGVAGAISVCSRFVFRKEFFWRFKLSYLNTVDGMRILRSHLRKHGYRMAYLGIACCRRCTDLISRAGGSRQGRKACFNLAIAPA